MKDALFFIASILLATLAIACMLREQERQEWKTYQKAYQESLLSYRHNGSNQAADNSEDRVMPKENCDTLPYSNDNNFGIKEIRPTLTDRPERCLTCHEGIEEISASHPVETFGCISCHGGNGLGLTIASAHQDLLGGRNPSDLSVIDKTCAQPGGRCHSGRLQSFQNVADRVKTGLMATMAGVISSLRFSWGAQKTPAAEFASTRTQGFAPHGSPPEMLAPIPMMYQPENPITGHALSSIASGEASDDQWRKFCSRCHLWSSRESGASAHSSGCAACHAIYNGGATYEGNDPTISKSKPGYSRRHSFTTKIPVEQCQRCHNRSGRIGLTFTGLMEADGYGTPFKKGRPNSGPLSGGRDVRHLTPDIHYERGLACIDCHTGSDLMGNGTLYHHARDQVEIRCTDCHGDFDELPRTKRITPDDNEAVWRARTLNQVDPTGMEFGLTERNSPILNLRIEGDRLILRGKLDGKDHPCPVITGDKFHRIPGHREDRMECSACHARWAPQCYGCHDYRRRGLLMEDVMSGAQTDGRWFETRDYYRFEKPALGINTRGRVCIMVPGCQVIYTELGADGLPIPGIEKKVLSSPSIAHGIVSTPITPHATRLEVRPCQECHMDAKTLGFGEGLFEAAANWKDNAFTPLADPSINPMKFSWESMVDANGNPLVTSTHEGARPFCPEELRRILRVAPCLPCHNRYDDPIWENPADAFARAKSSDHRRRVARFLEEGTR